MIRRSAADWRRAPDEVWLVDGTMVAVIEAVEAVTGERVRQVAVRLGSTLNTVGTDDDRTYILGLDELSALMAGLMAAGQHAYGQGSMMTAMADALDIDPGLRDRTTEAVDRAVEGLDS